MEDGVAGTADSTAAPSPQADDDAALHAARSRRLGALRERLRSSDANNNNSEPPPSPPLTASPPTTPTPERRGSTGLTLEEKRARRRARRVRVETPDEGDPQPGVPLVAPADTEVAPTAPLVQPPEVDHLAVWRAKQSDRKASSGSRGTRPPSEWRVAPAGETTEDARKRLITAHRLVKERQADVGTLRDNMATLRESARQAEEDISHLTAVLSGVTEKRAELTADLERNTGMVGGWATLLDEHQSRQDELHVHLEQLTDVLHEVDEHHPDVGAVEQRVRSVVDAAQRRRMDTDASFRTTARAYDAACDEIDRSEAEVGRVLRNVLLTSHHHLMLEEYDAMVTPLVDALRRGDLAAPTRRLEESDRVIQRIDEWKNFSTDRLIESDQLAVNAAHERGELRRAIAVESQQQQDTDRVQLWDTLLGGTHALHAGVDFPDEEERQLGTLVDNLAARVGGDLSDDDTDEYLSDDHAISSDEDFLATDVDMLYDFQQAGTTRPPRPLKPSTTIQDTTAPLDDDELRHSLGIHDAHNVPPEESITDREQRGRIQLQQHTVPGQASVNAWLLDYGRYMMHPDAKPVVGDATIAPPPYDDTAQHDPNATLLATDGTTLEGYADEPPEDDMSLLDASRPVPSPPPAAACEEPPQHVEPTITVETPEVDSSMRYSEDHVTQLQQQQLAMYHESLKQELLTGRMFQKHGRLGAPHFRHVSVDDSLQTIMVKDDATDAKPVARKHMFALQDVTLATGYGTEPLRKAQKRGVGEDLCFALLAGDGRSLNLQAPAPSIRDMWVDGLNYLIGLGRSHQQELDMYRVHQQHQAALSQL